MNAANDVPKREQTSCHSVDELCNCTHNTNEDDPLQITSSGSDAGDENVLTWMSENKQNQLKMDHDDTDRRCKHLRFVFRSTH